MKGYYSKEKLIKLFFLTISITTLLLLTGIFFFLFITGINAFSEITPKEFFLGKIWNPEAYGMESWGILSLILSTSI